MWRSRRVVQTSMIAACSLALVGLASQWALSRRDLSATPPPGQRVDVGGYRLHLWCLGDSGPTVLFDADLGGTSLDAYEVMTALSSTTRACSYDRAGMGFSEPGPSPRTSRRIASELARLLSRSRIAPVVLVGRSFTTLSARIVASEHPELVSGMVLVDPLHEDETRRIAAAGDGSTDSPPSAWLVTVAARIGLLRALGLTLGAPVRSAAPQVQPWVHATAFHTNRYLTWQSELTHMQESADEVRKGRRELPIPIVVVGRRAGGAGAALRAELRRDLLRLSTLSCERAGPETARGPASDADVANAVRSVIEAIAANSAPHCN